ncbi:MAG: UvrB/UvrC motif-containing protein [bacterium]|nr:UvrB/UvrC motif-containing protein [bacterium]
MEHFKYLSKAKLAALPKAPGVYAFLKGKGVLYIGKAANLRDRVKTHFQQPSYRDNLFMGEVERVGYQKTDSDIDALLLESQLIKKLQPRYNVIWKDDKKYFYVAVTKDRLPRVFLTHQPVLKEKQKKEERAEYLGPFTEGKSIKRTLSLLRRVFPYYSAKRHGPLPCPYCHLNLCPGPEPDANEYAKDVRKLDSVLKGRKTSVLKQLEQEMKTAAKKEDFERASTLRDQFLSLERIISHARLLSPGVSPSVAWEGTEQELQKLFQTKKRISRIEAYDISNIQGLQATGSQVTFVKGVPAKESYRKYKIRIEGKPDDFAMMKELVSRRLQHPEWPYPQLMVIDGGKGQLSSAASALREAGVNTIFLSALAKREEELFFQGRPGSVRLRDLPRPVENLFLHIRDEAHRFAVAYHRKLRTKALGLTELKKGGRIA